MIEGETEWEQNPENQRSSPLNLTHFRQYTIDGKPMNYGGEADIYRVRDGEGTQSVLKLYRSRIVPHAQILEKIFQISRQYSEELIQIKEFGLDSDTARWYEILEYATYGSLKDLLQEGHPNPDLIRVIIREVVTALYMLHENSILHLDLKPSNILIRSKEPLDLVLSDFGISTLFNPEISRKITQVKGTPQYWAPEQMTGVVGKEVDYWALGMIALELLMGSNPFANTEKPVVMYTLTTKSVEISDTLPRQFIPFLKGCLTRDPKKRWGYSEITRWLRGDLKVPIYYDQEKVTEVTKPYRFQGQQYHDFASLLYTICESEETWAEGLKHLGRGFIYKWLEDNNLYDEAVQVNEYLESNKDLDCALSLIVARYAPDAPFLLSGKEICNDTVGACLGHDLQNALQENEKKLVQYILDGTLLDLYDRVTIIQGISVPNTPPTIQEGFDQWCVKNLLYVSKKTAAFLDPLIHKTLLFHLSHFFAGISPLYSATPFSPEVPKQMVILFNQDLRAFERFLSDLPEFPLLYLDQFSTGEPEHLGITIARAHHFDWTGRRQKGAILWRDINKQVDEASILGIYAKARIFENNNDWSAAISVYDEVITKDQNYADAWYGKGITFEQIGNFEGSLNAFSHVIPDQYPAGLDILIRRAYLLLTLNRKNEALSAYERVLNADPYNPTAHYRAGVFYAEKGEHLKALTSLDKALSFSYDAEKIWFRRALIYEKFAQPQEALDAYDKAIALDPTCEKALLGRAKILEDSGESIDALIAYDKVLQLNSKNADALMKKTYLAEKMGRTQEAIEGYDQLIQINPGQINLWVKKAELLESIGKVRESHEVYDHALALSPKNPRILHKKATTLLKQGRERDALDIYYQISEIDPNDFDAWFNIGKIQFKFTDETPKESMKIMHLDEAQRAYQNAMRINPGHRDTRDAAETIQKNLSHEKKKSQGKTLGFIGILGFCISSYALIISVSSGNSELVSFSTVFWIISILIIFAATIVYPSIKNK